VKSPQLAFVVSTDEYLRIKRKSEKAHMSISDYVRVALGLPPNYRLRLDYHGLNCPGRRKAPR
jgi:hypothetical protein